MQVVYQAQDIIDANLVKDRLEQAGLTAFVNGQYLAGAMGELPVGGIVSVAVADSDGEAALAAIKALDAERAASDREESGETRWDMNDGLGDWVG